MSISNLTTNLTNLNPVYNPLVYGFDSTNKNQPGFRYVVDVYSAGTATKLFEARVAPRPNDGYGYIDLSKILSNLVTFDLDVTNTTSSAILNSYINYDVKIGEEYIVSWPFDDSTFVTGNLTRLIQTGSTTPNTFVDGDQIVVTLNNPALFPALDGLQVVYSAVSAYNIIIDIPFVTSAANPGIVKYADNRKTVYRNLYSYTGHTAWNGALPFKTWPSYSSTDYKITTTSTTNKLLTNIPSNFYMASTQDMWINWVNFNSSTPKYAYFVNDAGDTFRKDISNTTQKLRQFSAGPNNVGTLSTVSGTAPLVKANTEYYDFYVTNTSGTQMSKKYRVYIDTRCKIEDYEILFQDRLGSFSSYSFQLRNKVAGTVKRDTFNRQIGDISGGKWTYDSTSIGEYVSNVSVSKLYDISTNWMTNEMNVYFEELVTSPITYIKIDGIYYACTVQDNGFEVQSSRSKKLIKRNLTIKLANEDIVNI